MKKTLSVAWIFVICLIWPTLTVAFQEDMEAVYADSFAKINEPSVKDTISYLASDEMGGRGTGSLEFELAAEFVAKRFEKAGLVGGAPDGSFFHFKELTMYQVPSEGVELSVDGKAIEHLGLLSATSESVSLSGAATSVDLSDLPKENIASEIAFARFESPQGSEGQRGGPLQSLSTAAARLKSKGAKVLILGVNENDPIVMIGQAARAVAKLPRRAGIALPVLLVEVGVLDQLKTEVSISLPSLKSSTYKAKNVIGVLKGTDPNLSKQALMFSAHLDHLGRQENGSPDPIFNGADDDASGVTAVLTLADAFSQLPKQPARSVLFVTFWGEESGLLGSKDFAENPPWPLENIIANVNIEMIGRPEPGANGKIWMTGWEQSDLGIQMNRASQGVKVEIFEHPKYSAMLYRSSDNYSLAEKGVIAHSFSGGSLHGDYHQPTDEWQKLNLPHMTLVIKGLFAGSLPLVGGKVTPKKNETASKQPAGR